MTRKHYTVMGLVSLVVTILGTSVLILIAKNTTVGVANKEANPYNTVPVGKVVMQTTGYDGKNTDTCKIHQVALSEAYKLMRMGEQKIRDKEFKAAVDFYATSLECLKQYPGLGCPQAIKALTEKAKCEKELGFKAEREKTLRLLITAASQTCNDGHEQLALALENLGDLLCDQDRAVEALPLIERAYAIRVNGAGADRRDTAYTISLLAHCNLNLKNYQPADELYKRAISIYEHLDGEGFSESQQIARENLANSYRWQNRYQEAIDSELDLLADLKKKHLADSYYAASTLISAASTAQSQKDRAKMQEYLSQAERIAAQFRTADCHRAADLYSNIADVYNDDDALKAELAARQKCLASYKILKYPEEEDKEQLAKNQVKAGACALKLNDFTKAQEYYGQALAEARDNEGIRLKLRDNKVQIEEYLRYIEKALRGGEDATIKMQAGELKRILVG